ncbi:MAG: hypothetical protein J6Q65_04475, partial [Lentisphaeria bacterium]|nr:hypothetical protein [Lentisphaeria bacterium]
MKNEEITENEMDRKMDTDLEKTFSILQKSLKEQTAEPPAMVDSSIKAAARQRLKKEYQAGKLRFIAWFTGAAAVFAVTFSALYFTGFTGTMQPEQTAQMGTETFAADPEQDWDWDL